MRPVVALAFLVGPGEDDNDAIAALVDRVDAGVVIAVAPPPLDRGRESLTGLRGTVSGWWRPPQPPRGAPTAPLHVRVDQRHEWFDVPVAKRVIRVTDRVSRHPSSVVPVLI